MLLHKTVLISINSSNIITMKMIRTLKEEMILLNILILFSIHIIII